MSHRTTTRSSALAPSRHQASQGCGRTFKVPSLVPCGRVLRAPQRYGNRTEWCFLRAPRNTPQRYGTGHSVRTQENMLFVWVLSVCVYARPSTPHLEDKDGTAAGRNQSGDCVTRTHKEYSLAYPTAVLYTFSATTPCHQHRPSIALPELN